MKESVIAWLLILVFTEPGVAKPTVKVTVTKDQLACEQSRLAIQRASTYPLLVCQCAPLDLQKAAEVIKPRR